MESLSLKVLIDKISLIYTVKDKNHFNIILGVIYNLKSEWVGNGKFFWKTKYCTKVKFKLDNKCDLLIVVGTSKGNNYVRFEFNVDKLRSWME